jgi:hypothetical protein
MVPVKFPGSTTEFRRPNGMTEEQCASLPALKSYDEEGFPVIVSCFKPSFKERLQLLFGGSVWLGILGNSQPPVWIVTETPFNLAMVDKETK